MSDLEQIADLVEQMPYDPLGWDGEVETPEEVKAWAINDKAEAAWAMEKLAGYARQQAENDAIADERITRLREQIEEVQSWNRQENNKLQGSVDYFTGQLQTWHMSQVTADPDDDEAWKKEKFKTITLPDGVVSVRKGSLSTVIESETSVVEWATKNRNDLLKLSLISTAKSEIAKHIDETGEVVPGIKRERSQPKFDVKPKVGE